MKNGIHKFNHLVKGIPNTEENREEIKRINKQAKASKSRWRLAIKYRKPKEGQEWGWGGTLSCENADEFAVYVRDQISWEDRPENKSYQRMAKKYRDLLQKYNMRELKGIVSELLENVQELSYAVDRNEDWRNVFSSLRSVTNHLNEDLKDLEGI